MVLAALTFFLLAGGSDGAQLSAGPVRLFGGKSQRGDTVFLLDIGVGGEGPSRIFAFPWRRSSAVRIVELQGTPKPLEPYGLARPNDGTFWILAGKGRSVARFDESTGRLLHFEALPQACEGIWDFGTRVILAPVQWLGGEPLLASAERGGFRPFTSLKARSGSSAPETLVRNLMECGFVVSSRLPCWWLSGAPEVALINKDEEVRVFSIPSLVDPRLLTPTAKASPNIESLTTDLPYPIRDVLLLPRDSLWVLTNQEGSRPLSEPAAVRSRHVIRVDGGKKAKTVELPKAGKAILGGDEGGLLLLYRDGSIGWLSCQ